MCIGNRASSSAYYINKQFETLWQISQECVNKHGHGIKPTRAEVEYGSCLAQLCVGKHASAKPCTNDLKFFASFGAPQLQFICNHEAILTLKLNLGHYKLDGKSRPEAFEVYTCAFRVQFHEHLITDTSFSIFGQTAACKAKILVLDLSTASFLREFSGFPKGHKLSSETVDRHHKSIVKYVSTSYLPLISKAGFHCIHSLPDFDNLSRTHMIDYSTVSDVDVDIFDLFGISIESINTFMTGRWLESAACLDELDEHHDHSSFGQFALTEHRSVCDDISFHAYFGPPQIRALCSQEVIFYLDIEKLDFYLNGFHCEATHNVSNWKIAVVVQVHLEEEEGCIRRLRLDFSKSRFCEHRSICTRSDTMEESIFIKLRTVFVQYITKTYVSILEEFHHDHVYHVDIRVIEVEEEDSYTDDEELIVVSSEFQERLCITETFGYDMITTITQGSINDHLRCVWKASQSTRGCLTNWVLDEFFVATFGPIQIQFPCDSSSTVIVYIDLRKGFLTNLGPFKTCIGGEKHDFAGWKLAFEVQLNLRDYTKAHSISDGCLKRQDVGEYLLKQLVLEFSTAKFRQDLSRLPGLLEGGDYCLMRSKRSALLHYINHFYWAQLKREGHHVLYTIPIRKHGSESGLIQRAAACSLSFHFLAAPCGDGEKYVSCLFGSQSHLGSRNMLVICGMVDPRHRPVVPLPRCTWRWISSHEAFSGAFVLSRSVFLDGWLLQELGRINERTTLVPHFQGIRRDGKFDLELVPWKEHSCTDDRSCAWKQIYHFGESLKFEWKNMDEWTYIHRGDACDVHNGGYTISCKTANSLTLPTVSHHGACEIEIKGQVDFNLCFKGETKNWSTSATAKWSATIRLAGDRHGGLKVTTSFTRDIPEPSGFTGDFDIVHPAILLKKHLVDVTLFEKTTIHELESAFTGVWPLFYSGTYGYTLTNPIFNSHGDLLFELVRPVDHEGNICVSAEDRPDICLPSKTSVFSRTINVVTGSSLMSSLTSMLTSSTGIDTPIKTPPLDHALSSNSKVEIREEHERVEFGAEEVQTTRSTLEEKVHRSFDSYSHSDLDLEL